MNKHYIFDVDGTLTPSRMRMNDSFRLLFADFAHTNNVYVVTGSDRQKTLEQLGSYVVDFCLKRAYQCSGNDVWERGKNIRSSTWILPLECKEFLFQFLSESEFPKRTGYHFDHRPGLCNFSVLGRGASLKERADYMAFDKRNSEREKIVTYFNAIFPNVRASLAGETGIDISPLGRDKTLVLEDFPDDEEVIFVGDSTFPGGNDYEIYQKVLDRKNGRCYTVNSWTDTLDLVKYQFCSF